MSCCKLGCDNEEMKASQYVAFRRWDGTVVRYKIEWCQEHGPESILMHFEDVELLRDRGASY